MANLWWSFEEECSVIDFHRGNRILWDPKHPEYFNRNKRSSLLQQLAENLEIEFRKKIRVNDIKKKWKNLRSTFSKEMRKRNLPSGSAASAAYTSKWCHFNDMLFLNDIICDESIDSFSQELSSDDIPEILDDDNPQTSPSPSPSVTSIVPSTLSNTIRNKKDVHVRIMENVQNLMEIVVNRNMKSNGIDGFLQNTGDVLRKLSFVTQQKTMLKIQEMLVEAIEEDRHK